MTQDQNPDMQKLIRILSEGISDKVITENISEDPIDADGRLIEIHENSVLSQEGGIQDRINFTLKKYDCGCLSWGRKNLGGICSRYDRKLGRPHIVCLNHLYRCIVCHRPVCVLCARSVRGVVYCRKHAFIKKLKRLFFIE